MKNFYKILGLASSANDDEIKRCYRQMAKRYHPDVNKGDSNSAQRFADINEAYETLSDPDRRSEYDKQISVLLMQKNMRMARGDERTANQSMSGAQANPYQNAQYQAYNQNYQQFFSQAGQDPFQYAQAQAQAQAVEVQRQSFNKGYSQGFTDAQKRFTEEANIIKKQTIEIQIKLKEATEYIITLENTSKLHEQDLQKKNDEIYKLTLDTKVRQNAMGEYDRKLHDNKNNVTNLSNRLQEAEHRLMSSEQIAKDLSYNNAEFNEKQRDLENKLRAMTGRAEYNSDKRKEAEEAAESYRLEKEKLQQDIQALHEKLDEWEGFFKTQQYQDDMCKKEHDWSVKNKEDKKRAKNTLYGKLGVLLWATQEEIHENYIKLVKRYQKRKEDDKVKEKIFEINDAYRILSDAQTREIYNDSLNLTEEEITLEREKTIQYEDMCATKNAQNAEKEFWEKVEDIMLNAQVGDAEAQNTLGEMYYYGDELDKDLEQAVYWFKEAAKQQNPDALYNFGNCLLKGEGISKDEAKGRGFIKQAGNIKREAVQKATAEKAAKQKLK